MTLVRNLRQRLNGNNQWLLLVLILGTLSSCDAFRKAQTDDYGSDEKTEAPEVLDDIQGDQVFNPRTGQYEYSTDVTEALDTVKWSVQLPENNPPIGSEATELAGGTDVTPPLGSDPNYPDDGKSEKLNRYNVAFLLPFYSHRFGDGTELPRSSGPALQFYGGAKMALDELAAEDLNLNVTVHDTKGSRETVRNLMGTRELQEAHMVVGPFIKDNIKIAAEAAKVNRTPIISPISPSSNVTNNNSYFVQVSPYLQTHCEAITQHVRARHRPEQIVLVVRNKEAEISRLRYFQAENARLNGSEDGPRLKEFIVTDQTSDFSEMDISSYILEGDTTVFVVPSWSNESFIYSLMRNLQVAKQKNHVIVYGMPQWMKYQRISYDYFEQLHLHVSSSFYTDMDNSDVTDFKQKYFDRYGIVPGNEAYIGYDVMLYFGRMMSKHGTRFQDRLDAEAARYLHTQFSFVREVPLSAALEEDFSKTNLIQNKYVNILKFEDYYFQLAE